MNYFTLKTHTNGIKKVCAYKIGSIFVSKRWLTVVGWRVGSKDGNWVGKKEGFMLGKFEGECVGI